MARGMLHSQNTSLSTERKKQCEFIGMIHADLMWVEKIPPLGQLVPHAALGKEKETTPKTCPECIYIFFLNFPFSQEERDLAIIMKTLH